MEKLLLIKYGELTTKGDNRNYFIKLLVKSIVDKLVGINYEIEEDYYRMFIHTDDVYVVLDRLKSVFGIHEIVVAYKVNDTGIDSICTSATNVLKNARFNTFKIETNRSDKSYEIKSNDVSRFVGASVLKNINGISVDVHNPDVLLNVEIRREAVYLYYESYAGMNGYPVGTMGKALLMLSGGIDSVVAGYLSIKRGVSLDFLYFESIPHTSLEARNKVIALANILCNYGNVGRIYVVNFTKIQEYIYKNMKSDYLITFMRRMMYRIAEKLANNIGANAIINGENIGQVASQTLTSIKAVNDVTNFPIIRPLATYDKLEIIDISKKIGTYDISILPYEDCCTVFVPKHPVINPKLDVIYSEEEKFDFDLIDKVFEDILVLNIPTKEESSEYL